MSNSYAWGSPAQLTGAEWTLEADTTTAVLDVSDEVADLFAELLDQWHAETATQSSLTKRYSHTAYQRIVGLGPAAVPILLGELEARPDYWFHALRAITGEDPVPQAGRGNLRAMTDAWLAWGRLHGHLAA